MAAWKESNRASMPLEAAWLEYADFEMPELQLRRRYEVLLGPAVSGNPVEHPNRPWQEFEPTGRWDRGRMAEQREKELRRNLFHLLGEGKLEASGIQVSPGINKLRTLIHPGFFKMADALGDQTDWLQSGVTVGATIYAEVLVHSPCPTARRGAPSKRQEVLQVITLAEKQHPHLERLPDKKAAEIIRTIFDAHPAMLPKGGVSDTTIIRVLRSLRGSRKRVQK